MKYILFTKMVKELSVEKLIATVKELGLDGMDLCVRDGYPVNPGNAREEMPRAAKLIRDAGLSVPLVSAATNLIDPASDTSETLYRSCHDSGVHEIKIGYWAFKPKTGSYWKQVDAARKDIEKFAVLSARYGVRTCLHTHSGANLGVNASAMMHLLRGFDPAQVGAYLDPGHLALNGEPLSMAFDMTSEYLALVAIKDCVWQRGEEGKPARSKFLAVGEGLVDWAEMFRILKARGFPGPLSFHSEYEFPIAGIIAQTRRDVQYMRRLESQTR